MDAYLVDNKVRIIADGKSVLEVFKVRISRVTSNERNKMGRLNPILG